MTATETPCTAPDADRFGRFVAVPDPPLAHPARKRYWEDTVFEAVGELRRRLASGREEVVTSALDAVLAVEKTRMRHGRPVSGTQVPNVYEREGFVDDLPKLGPLEVDTPLPPNRPKCETPAEPPNPGLAAGDEKKTVPVAQVSEPISQQTTPIVAGREAGTTPPEPPPPLPAEPPVSSVSDPEFLAVLAGDRAAYLELTGTYPEDDFPDWAVWAPFKADPRPHPAELRWRMRQAGTVIPPTPANAVC